jgi:FkbM family methyltransferase
MNIGRKISNAWRELQEPWIIFRPSQIIRRIIQQSRSKLLVEEKHRTAWGASIWCNPQKAIGENIRFRGIFDIVVSEVLIRLLKPGSTLVDAGSNLGYMSLLGARAVGSNGQVVTFEPNPEIIPILNRNVNLSAKNPHCARVHVIESALGSDVGISTLFAPANYLTNDGVARLKFRESEDRVLDDVPVTTLDLEMAGQHIDVLKMDVEGHEFEVLRGAESLLATGHITHIVFEDHAINESLIPPYLTKFGYNLFRLGYTLTGLNVTSLDNPLAPKYDGSPSYLATLLSSETISSLLQRRGWHILREFHQ